MNPSTRIRATIAAVAIMLAFPHVGLAAGTLWVAESSQGYISQVSLDGTFVTRIAAGGVPYAIAVDPSGGKLYWLEYLSGELIRTNLDGSGLEQVLTGEGTPRGLAIDASRLYWTTGTSVRSLALGGGTPTTLATGTSPAGITSDGSFVYWSDYDGATINRTPVGGGSTTTLASVTQPLGIALSPTHAYFGSANNLKRLPLAGGAVETVVFFINHPTTMVRDSDTGIWYWTDPATGDIRFYDESISALDDIVSGLSEPRGLAFVADPGLTVAPSQCLAAKIKAIAKREKSSLLCLAKATKTGDLENAEPCVQKVQAKFDSAFAKAGTCAGDSSACAQRADQCVSQLSGALPDVFSGIPNACEATRVKVAAKLATALLNCTVKAAKSGVPVVGGEDSCYAKARAKFQLAFDKVSGCTGDAATVEGLIMSHCFNRPIFLDRSLNVADLCR